MNSLRGPKAKILRHIKLLLRFDSDFLDYWSNLDTSTQDYLIRNATSIERVPVLRWRLTALHREASEMTKRLLLVVPDQEFQWSRIPERWLEFVRDEQAKKNLFKYSKRDLQAFLRDTGMGEKAWLYGGIKSEESLDRKYGSMRQRERPGIGISDLWDVVRFRIVTQDLLSLREVALKIWTYRFEQIVRCRNFFFNPKSGNFDTPYRAIHFELELLPQRLIEIQLMTQSREIASVLDHAVLFKGSIPSLGSRRRRWIWRFGLKANIYDVLELRKQVRSSPGSHCDHPTKGRAGGGSEDHA